MSLPASYDHWRTTDPKDSEPEPDFSGVMEDIRHFLTFELDEWWAEDENEERIEEICIPASFVEIAVHGPSLFKERVWNAYHDNIIDFIHDKAKHNLDSETYDQFMYKPYPPEWDEIKTLLATLVGMKLTEKGFNPPVEKV